MNKRSALAAHCGIASAASTFLTDISFGRNVKLARMTQCIEHRNILQDAFHKGPTNMRLPPSPPVTNHIFFDEVDNADFRFEATRLESFKNWPCVSMKPERLASAGFYYTSESDKVRCFECHVEISQWLADDDPMVDHQRWSGRCRFIRNIPCGNVPIGVDPATIPPAVPRGRDVCGPYSTEYHSDPATDDLFTNMQDTMKFGLEGRTKGPKHPEFASYDTRLRTFETWPISISQNKEQLAAAGFYYTGNSDQTLCYYCGGGLKDWEPDDDPWQQHATWFSKCYYLLTVKGQDYVNGVIAKSSGKQETPENTSTKATKQSVSEKLNEEGNDECNPGPSSQNSIASDDSGIGSLHDVNVEPSAAKPHHVKPIDDARICKICYNRELRKVFVPCGHLVACAECATNMKTCAVCRKPVMDTVQAIIS